MRCILTEAFEFGNNIGVVQTPADILHVVEFQVAAKTRPFKVDLHLRLCPDARLIESAAKIAVQLLVERKVQTVELERPKALETRYECVPATCGSVDSERRRARALPGQRLRGPRLLKVPTST